MDDFSKQQGSGSRGPLTLSSMAKSIALQTTTSTRTEEPCPVTPESNMRQIVASGLEEALAMVSPVDTPTPSPYPSMASLASLASQEVGAPIPEAVDNSYFGEGIQSLLASDLNDFDVDHNLLIDNAELPDDCALDPLFMLDDVVGAVI